MTVKTITVKEIANKIIRGEDLFIVDVRNQEEYADWRIEGKNVQVVNIPYFEVLDGVDPFLEQLPKEKENEIYVVCAKGKIYSLSSY
ncbi:rhodanese-like domain-containing protein [Aeribacillus sp. FSL K6-1305]|uniref:rhodanese-like domain-containing protein n=1 Tax=Aeribacillus sp. FSL K6-1305 TaxID=2954569 RepID=UPI0030FD90CD